MSQTHRVDSRRRHLAGLDVDETPAMIQADLRNAYGAILQVEGARSCGAVLLELCATGCRAAAARRSADVATMRSRVDQRQDQQRTGACHVWPRLGGRVQRSGVVRRRASGGIADDTYLIGYVADLPREWTKVEAALSKHGTEVRG